MVAPLAFPKPSLAFLWHYVGVGTTGLCFPASVTQTPASSRVLRTKKASLNCSSLNTLAFPGQSCPQSLLRILSSPVEARDLCFPGTQFRVGASAWPVPVSTVCRVGDRAAPCWTDLDGRPRIWGTSMCIFTPERSPPHLSATQQCI